MREQSHLSCDALSPSLLQRLEEVWQRLEVAWRAGQRPRIEDYLGTTEPDRSVLLRDLLALELAFRRQRGETPLPEDYLQRFPEHGELVHAAFAEDAASAGQPSAQGASLRPQDETLPTTHADQPVRLGRYRITAQLGAGGFGVVYKAYDEELRRDVAIKMPHRRRLSQGEDGGLFVAEARILASLDHPNIVPVHDVGRTEDGSCFVVSKFIEGKDLRRKLKESPASLLEAVEWVAAMADALHHAHHQGLVHRDVKPSNILIDRSGRPYLADFGLALREDDLGSRTACAGTPAYMSPEQARGEGHRVDGRSDIFSLGVVFYELLTGRVPFHGKTQAELLDAIATVEPRPPRQLDDTIARELERICLKALAKRATERYTTAKDLADDLRHFYENITENEKDAARARVSSLVRTAPIPSLTPTPSPPIKIVPKGLRSYDAKDADFFLELLPGPRDRDGLPENVRFWKSRVEETDPDNTFAVGLIYGPSGCGKSSLVRAGLLPRLANHVIAIYIEATSDETETRLLKGLRKHFPDLPVDLSLTESLAAIRRGRSLHGKQKVLLILDQFEQWLHAKRAEENTSLVQALRQCDGGRVQSIVMIRDDFWLAVSRFLRELEIRLVEGQNSALVDLFDLRHARKVLTAFGRAFGALPDELDTEQKAFLEQAVSGLAQEGKVISVRLALFAEMVKGKPWTPATLKAVGGIGGIGVTFLEETFSATTSPPEHRYHQKAAPAVLKALLPETGAEIKGNMRPRSELLEVSGYTNRPADFDELLRILDGDLRILTPTDPEQLSAAEKPGQSAAGEKYYELTHDYLVPSLREWLTRKQKETRNGQAELRLTERAAHWSAKAENRYLPAWWEWANIRLRTRKSAWTAAQQRMMRQAARYHALRGSLLLACCLLLGWLGFEGFARLKAGLLIDRLRDAQTTEVPGIVGEIASYRHWANPLLRQEYEQAGEGSRQKLHASLALLPVDPGQVEYLHGRLLDALPQEFPVIRHMLADHRKALIGGLWEIVDQPPKARAGQRLRAACALAVYDPDAEHWQQAGGDIAADLVSAPAVFVAPWMDALRPVRGMLLEPLAAIFRDTTRRETERALAAEILADYAKDEPAALADLLMDADDKQFAALYAKLREHGEPGQTALHAELDRKLRPEWNDPPLQSLWQQADASVKGKIESAYGVLHERFAFCQTMTWEDFLGVAEGLRPSGYRPIRFRPYAVGKAIQVAAVWTRDGQEWHLASGLSAEEMRKHAAAQQKKGYQPIDVTGYLEGPAEHYAALWVKRPAATAGPVELAVGLKEPQLEAKENALQAEGYRRATSCTFVDAAGETRYAVIWTSAPGQTTPGSNARLDESFIGLEPDYSGENHPGDAQVDVQVGRAALPASTKDRLALELKDAAAEVQAWPDRASARLQRGRAYLYLGEPAKAAQDLSWLIEKASYEVDAYRYRAIAQARQGKARAAKVDLAKFLDLAADPGSKAYLDAVVSAYLGEEAAGLKRLEASVALHSRQADFLYAAACAFSAASRVVAPNDMTRAKLHAARALALLKDAVANGYSNYSEMQSNPDLDPLRTEASFVTLLEQGKVNRRYAAVWHADPLRTSTEIHGLDPAQHLTRCRQLQDKGLRPVSISVAEVRAGQPLVTASVWHGSVIPDKDKERLAKRQANAAVALLKMNQAERVWPLLKHSPDPRLRSYLIHRLSPMGADPKTLLQRLDEEQEVSVRRALLLSLGTFGPEQVPLAERELLVPKMLRLYRDDPDPGVHGAAEWLLRQWKEEEKPKGMDKELATGKVEGQRGWYVNRQGQTMVIIREPVDFLMGSPGTEADRVAGAEGRPEAEHRQRIGHSYAIAAKEVTVAEFLRFRKDHKHTKQQAPTPDCPVNEVTWYDAAAYCNWLSAQEGIAKDQWCYESNAKGEFAEGMRLKPGYLKLVGYRLPSEAEWEYACRAGAVTSRFHGETEELLSHYAWYMKNSQGRRMQPAGSLQPNDLGLFDMLGNALEWCQEILVPYAAEPGGKARLDVEDQSYVPDRETRVARGGAFDGVPISVRAADRCGYVPTYSNLDVGFRPARTFP